MFAHARVLPGEGLKVEDLDSCSDASGCNALDSLGGCGADAATTVPSSPTAAAGSHEFEHQNVHEASWRVEEMTDASAGSCDDGNEDRSHVLESEDFALPPPTARSSRDSVVTEAVTEAAGDDVHDASTPTEVQEPAEVAAAAPPILDQTVLLDEDCGSGYGTADNQDGGAISEEVLSLVSINPKTTRTVDIVRGRIVVHPDLPHSMAAIRTVQISCGRHTGNTVVLNDARVSLRHFALRMRVARGGAVALDLHDLSSNGTWVNGQCVGKGNRVPLTIGDRIVILPAARVGRTDETGYVLLHDPKGVRCCPDAPVLEPPSQSEDVKPAAPPQPLPKALEDDLRCGICADALLHCLTLVPCGHNFCAACLVRWRRTSAKCPECRANVEQATQNNAIDKVVEMFLQTHPDMARSKHELAVQDLALMDRDNQAVLRWLLRGVGKSAGQASEVHAGVPTPARNSQSRRQQEASPDPQAALFERRRAPQSSQQRHARQQQTPQGSSACVVS